MAPTPRLSAEGLTTSAIGLIDSHGYDSLSVSAVAQDLAIAPSAIYTYCAGLDGLRNLAAVAATNNLTNGIRSAAIGTAGNQALSAMGLAFRNFVVDHPGQFAAMLRPPQADNSDLEAANAELMDVFTLVYAAMGLDTERSWLAARSTHSALHGFHALEHITGSTEGHDDEFQHLVEALQRGLA